ncbi:unnamed protein product [Sphenostylis stenocarpa]|uniref:Uncharacterized protein n=1 Tax=Sphenostylis stenocarpa TaxID=92480 RepID=A0AA86SED4_9FABA|nr:unnamed protein product [Sphenostylis stenocarpa]
MTSPPPLLPFYTSGEFHAPPLHVNPLYILGFLATTISTSFIIYLAYIHNDTPMLFFTSFIYVFYFSVDFAPLPPAPSARAIHFRLFLWALLNATIFALACSFWSVLTLPDSMCFLWVVIGGSALLLSAWSGESNFVAKKEQSFGPIMLMFLGLGRRYVTTQLILHAAIMNARKLVRPRNDNSVVNTKILSFS